MTMKTKANTKDEESEKEEEPGSLIPSLWQAPIALP